MAGRDVVEIRDNAALEQWLKGRPKELCGVLAARAALRAYPLVLFNANDPSHRPTTATHALLTSVLAARQPDEHIRAAVGAAYQAIYAASPQPRNAGFASASFAAETLTTYSANPHASAASAATALPMHGYLAAASRDATRIVVEGASPNKLFSVPLWHGEAVPRDLSSHWPQVSRDLRRQEPWRFWVAWYEGFLNGQPLDWKLQREIALIPGEDWEKGAEHIASLIAKIELKWRTSVAPQLAREEDAGVFRLASEDALPVDALTFVCERIETVLTNTLDAANNNALTEDSYEVIVVRRALSRHRDMPSLLATGLYDACLSFTRTIGEVYPDDTSLVNFKNALWSATEEICEISDDAKAQCARLASLAPPPAVTREDRQEAARVPDLLADELDAEAEAALREAATSIVEDATPPKSVRARFTQWVTTVSIWMDRAKKGDDRAKWLASVVSRLARWWPGDE